MMECRFHVALAGMMALVISFAVLFAADYFGFPLPP